MPQYFSLSSRYHSCSNILAISSRFVSKSAKILNSVAAGVVKYCCCSCCGLLLRGVGGGARELLQPNFYTPLTAGQARAAYWAACHPRIGLTWLDTENGTVLHAGLTDISHAACGIYHISTGKLHFAEMGKGRSFNAQNSQKLISGHAPNPHVTNKPREQMYAS